MAGASWGSPQYPSHISSTLELAAEPVQQCRLCHVSPAGGDAVTRPFGSSLKARGLVSNDEASLEAALAQSETDMVDSDNDTIPDITELRNATDPNSPNQVATDGGPGGSGGANAWVNSPAPSLRFGCGSDVVPAMVGLFGVVALGYWRRRSLDRP